MEFNKNLERGYTRNFSKHNGGVCVKFVQGQWIISSRRMVFEFRCFVSCQLADERLRIGCTAIVINTEALMIFSVTLVNWVIV